MSRREEEAKKVLEKFAPDERAFMEHVTRLKIDNKRMEKQIADLKNAYDDLWKVFITILHSLPDKELRIHKSQFLRFKQEYRIDKQLDGDEVVFKLLTVND